MDDIPSVVDNDPIHPEAMKAIVAFSRELKARGTDLIVMPIPSQVVTYTHDVIPSIRPEQTITPAYSRSLMELLDADVEVIDLRPLFREAALTSDFPVLHAGDHHWSTGGMQIATKLVMERLKRYSFPRKKMSWSQERRSMAAQTSLFGKNRIWFSKPSRKPPLTSDREEAFRMTKLPKKEEVLSIKTKIDKTQVPLYRHKNSGNKGRKTFSSHVVIVGDSMSFHLTGNPAVGSGFSNHLGAALDNPVSFFGKAGGAESVIRIFSEELNRHESLPRVVILIGRISPYTKKGWHPPVQLSQGKTKSVERPPALGDRATVVLSEVAAIPDPATVVYEDAVISARATIKAGPHKGKAIKVYHWAMRKRTLHPQAAKWKDGSTLTLKIMPWEEALRKAPGLDTVNSLDEVEDLMLPRYWTEIVR